MVTLVPSLEWILISPFPFLGTLVLDPKFISPWTDSSEKLKKCFWPYGYYKQCQDTKYYPLKPY